MIYIQKKTKNKKKIRSHCSTSLHERLRIRDARRANLILPEGAREEVKSDKENETKFPKREKERRGEPRRSFNDIPDLWILPAPASRSQSRTRVIKRDEL